MIGGTWQRYNEPAGYDYEDSRQGSISVLLHTVTIAVGIALGITDNSLK